jgi:hypothetical protein
MLTASADQGSDRTELAEHLLATDARSRLDVIVDELV